MKMPRRALGYVFALATTVSLCAAGSGHAAKAAEAASGARALADRAEKLADAGKPREALPLAREAAALADRDTPEKAPDRARCWALVTRLLRTLGEKKGAVEAARLTVRARELSAPNSVALGADLAHLAWTLQVDGQDAAAEGPLLRAFPLLDATPGAEPAELCAVASALGQLARTRGDTSGARSKLVHALDTAERYLGAKHRTTGIAATDLGTLLVAVKDPAGPAMLLRAVAILEADPAPEAQRWTAQALAFLAPIRVDAGELREGMALLRRAVTASERGGADDRQLASILSHLGASQASAGETTEALATLERAKRLADRATPADEALRASTLGALARAMEASGDHEGAEKLLAPAVASAEQRLGPAHEVTAGLMAELASTRTFALLSDHAVDRAATEQLFRRAIAIYGPSQPAFAAAVEANFGLFLWKIDRLEDAEATTRRALAALGAKEGAKASNATGLMNLGLILQDRGKLAEAESVMREALEQVERQVGAESPALALHLVNLAALRVRQGKPGDALPLLTRGQHLQDLELERAVRGGNDGQRRAVMAHAQRLARWPTTLHLQSLPSDPAAATLALQTILRQKARALDAGHSTIRALRERASPVDLEQLERLGRARADLATASLTGAPPARLEGLERAVLELEQRLAKKFSAIAIERTPVTVDAVRAVLRPGQALVEITAYRRVDAALAWGPERYAAYILLPTGPILARDLGEAATIDRAAREVRARMGTEGAPFVEAARALDALLLEPLRAMLGDVHDVWLSAEGGVNLVPIGALVDTKGRFAMERHRFTLLTSGRDLLRMNAPKDTISTSAPLLVTAPDFDASIGSSTAASAPLALGRIRFRPLPGTAREGQTIASLFPDARSEQGRAASKEAVLAVHGPRFLHVATHGFFFDQGGALAPAQRGFDLEQGAALPSDPLVRSGLAFAGANVAPATSLLSALEASSLDLWGTKLVALSACETGLGEVSRGEGVFGLRRALVLAGSETQIMSLWKVPDDATERLMVAYYKRILRGGGRSDALREAQVEVARDPATRHPYHWAAFVVSGDDRALDGSLPPPPREIEPLPPVAASAPAPPRVAPRSCACDTTPSTRSDDTTAAWVTLACAALVWRRRRTRHPQANPSPPRSAPVHPRTCTVRS